jgi:hypothetical protein
MRIGLTEVIVLILGCIVIYIAFRFFTRGARRKTIAKSSLPAKPATPISYSPPAQPKINVRLQPETRKFKAATETVNVPPGVTITVKRARQVEHSIDIGQSKAFEGGMEMGLKGIISSSVLGKIEQTQGRSYQQSETVEYQIELNGNQCKHYRLTWVDTFLTGSVEVQQSGRSQSIPFQFREGTELEVVPIA